MKYKKKVIQNYKDKAFNKMAQTLKNQPIVMMIMMISGEKT